MMSQRWRTELESETTSLEQRRLKDHFGLNADPELSPAAGTPALNTADQAKHAGYRRCCFVNPENEYTSTRH